MKVGFTEREKMLLALLIVLGVFCIYYFVFYVPMGDATQNAIAQNADVEDQIVLADAKVLHLKKMTAELEAMLGGNEDDAKKLPTYDNSKNVMAQLHLILGAAEEYSIDFAEVTAEEKTVRRDVNIRYSCLDYENAKFILKRIHDSQFRCMLKDVTLSRPDAAAGERYDISVKVTYYEYNGGVKPEEGGSEENSTEKTTEAA